MKEILCITTYPPRECGIATFSDDLINAIHRKFAQNFAVRVCAVESTLEKHTYPAIVKYKLNSSATVNPDTDVLVIGYTPCDKPILMK